MASAVPTNIVPIVIVGFVALRVITRVRRNIGRQRLTKGRMIGRIVAYAALTVLLAAVALMLGRNPMVLIGLLGGLAAGAGLGLVGLQLTTVETTSMGQYYTPNPYFGTAVSLLLVLRLAYRMAVLSGQMTSPRPQPDLMQSPLTMVLFGILAGYYMCYFSGLLLKSRRFDN